MMSTGHNLTKQGSGVVLFSNPNGNTYRGVTLINDGTIPPDSFPQLLLSLPVREGNDALVPWTGLAGSNYVLQAATHLSNGGGAFYDISPVITVQGIGEGVTNYLEM